jgi:hypothetical protein
LGKRWGSPERLTPLSEIEAGKAAIVSARQAHGIATPSNCHDAQTEATLNATLKKSNERSMTAPISLFIRRCK